MLCPLYYHQQRPLEYRGSRRHNSTAQRSGVEWSGAGYYKDNKKYKKVKLDSKSTEKRASAQEQKDFVDVKVSTVCRLNTLNGFEGRKERATTSACKSLKSSKVAAVSDDFRCRIIPEEQAKREFKHFNGGCKVNGMMRFFTFVRCSSRSMCSGDVNSVVGQVGGAFSCQLNAQCFVRVANQF